MINRSDSVWVKGIIDERDEFEVKAQLQVITKAHNEEQADIIDSQNAVIDQLRKEVLAYSEALDNVRESLGLEETHYLVIHDDMTCYDKHGFVWMITP